MWLENGWEILIKKGEEIVVSGGVGGILQEMMLILLEVGWKMCENGSMIEQEYVIVYKEFVGVNKNLFVQIFEVMVGSFFDVFDVNDLGYFIIEYFQ